MNSSTNNAKDNEEVNNNTETRLIYCTHCGNRIPSTSKFCPYCGQPVVKVNTDASTASSSSKTAPDTDKKTDTSAQKQSKPVHIPKESIAKESEIFQKYKGIIIGAAVAVVVLILVIALHKPTIDLNKYVDVSFSGYNTYGQAEVTVDNDKLTERLESLTPKDSKIKKKIQDALDEHDYDNYLTESAVEYYVRNPEELTYEVSYLYNIQSSGLSNGDKVTLDWNFDDNTDYQEIISILEQIYNCSIKASDKEYTVSGLQEVSTFDPFADITVTFSGMNGSGTAEISGTTEDGLSVSLDKSYDLSNGDTVTASIYNYDLDSWIEKNGKAPSPTEKEYEVTGLGEYIKSTAELSDDDLTKFKNQANDIITAFRARNSLDDGVTSAGWQCVDSYVLTKKEGFGYGTANELILVYDVAYNINYHYEAGEYSSIDSYDYNDIVHVYYGVAFDDIAKTSDGGLEADLSNGSLMYGYTTVYSRDDHYGKNWSFYGYASEDELVNDEINTHLDSYTVTQDSSVADTSAAADEG